MQLKNAVKPSDFILTGPFMSTPLRSCELETVARNIVVIMLDDGNAWKEFTFEKYKELCQRGECPGEEAVLDTLANDHHILDKNGTVYSVNENFFRDLAQFISQNDRPTEDE